MSGQFFPRPRQKYVRGFFYTPSSEDNLDVSGRCVACRFLGHHSGPREGGKRASKGCSVSGISCWDRKRRFVPPRSQFSSHKWPSPTTTIAATAPFATPPSYPSFSHQPRLLSYLLAAFCTVRCRWNDKWIYYARLNETECPYPLKRHSRFMKKCTGYSVPCSFPCFPNFERAGAHSHCVFPAFVTYDWSYHSVEVKSDYRTSNFLVRLRNQLTNTLLDLIPFANQAMLSYAIAMWTSWAKFHFHLSRSNIDICPLSVRYPRVLKRTPVVKSLYNNGDFVGDRVIAFNFIVISL